VVLAELLALVQAASTLTPSTTAAPAANRDLTPMVIPAETAFCRVKSISRSSFGGPAGVFSRPKRVSAQAYPRVNPALPPARRAHAAPRRDYPTPPTHLAKPTSLFVQQH